MSVEDAFYEKLRVADDRKYCSKYRVAIQNSRLYNGVGYYRWDNISYWWCWVKRGVHAKQYETRCLYSCLQTTSFFNSSFMAVHLPEKSTYVKVNISIMYDVIIIGAGPSGSSAARVLSANGYKVLLVEKMTMPRNKSCSGILINKTVNLVNKYFDDEVPKFTQCLPYESKGMVFTNDQSERHVYEQSGLNIWRSEFDYWLAKKAEEAGTELRTKTAAISCSEKENYVEVELKGNRRYLEKGKIVICCDGVVGSIKRQLLNKRVDYITTYQVFCKGKIDLDYHYFYAYLQKELSEYDAWFNVKDDYLIFGVSVKCRGAIPHYYKRFMQYMKDTHNAKIDKEVKAEQWLMPHIRPNCPIDYGKGRILFAGETAGFLNPMGEGISCGMESGYAAAKSIMQTNIDSNYNSEKLIDCYKINLSELHYYMVRQWNFVGIMSSTFEHMRLK